MDGSGLYLTREGQPSFRVWELLEQLKQSFRLFDTGDRFERKQISFCCSETLDLWSVPRFELLGRGRKRNRKQKVLQCAYYKRNI